MAKGEAFRLIVTIDAALRELDAIERIAHQESFTGQAHTPASDALDFVKGARSALRDARAELNEGGTLTPFFLRRRIRGLFQVTSQLFTICCAASHPEYDQVARRARDFGLSP